MPAPMMVAIIGSLITVEAFLFAVIWWATKSAAVAAKIIAGQIALIAILVLILAFWSWIAGVSLSDMITAQPNRSER